MRGILIEERKYGVHEECGIIGVSSPVKAAVARDIYFGLFALQHRGQESAGIAVQTDNKQVAYYKNMGLVNEVFDEEKLSAFPDSNVGIGHVRYSTTGSSNVVNAQPVVFYGRHGRMSVAHNGNIMNAAEIKQRLLGEGQIFQSSVDSEVLAALINFESDKGLESGILRACDELKGAFAFVLIADNELYAVRDRCGLKPLVIGKKNGAYVFASETCALDAIDAQVVRDVLPGEIIKITKDGELKSQIMDKVNRKMCVFEYVYLARTDSVIDELSVYDFRFNCGKILAKHFPIEADIVAGVPDSAVVSAYGYSKASGIPYADALSKNRYIGRTFIQPSQSMRENSVKIKLNAFRSNIKGKRLILIDDSIVRGTTSKKIIQLLRQNGAKEIHMLVASPIVNHPCYFGVDMQTEKQLIGAGRTEEEICKLIGADSVHYLPLECLKEACNFSGDDYCMGCFDGKYPMDVEPYKVY